MTPNPGHPVESRPWLPRALAAAAAALCLAFGSAACSSSPAPVQPPVRILIGFHEPVDGASPELLSRLERRAGVPIRYAAAVSPELHAYLLSCAASDPGCEAAIRSLRADPAVAEVGPDQLRSSH
jgi:hypothetical protein